MKTHAILLFSAALALSGCATDDARLREIDEAVREALRDAWAKAEAAAAQDEVAPPSGGDVPGGAVESQVVALPDAPSTPSTSSEAVASTSSTSSTDGADAVNFAALKWCWGAFDGSKAAEDAGARIGSLKVSASGLSYKWKKGGCEDLGASSKTDASCLACLFCFDGSAWRGGKFEWISTSRTSRSTGNIEAGYNGWDAAAFRSAKAHAFCIVSKDGRRRTNVIVQEGGLK